MPRSGTTAAMAICHAVTTMMSRSSGTTAAIMIMNAKLALKSRSEARLRRYTKLLWMPRDGMMLMTGCDCEGWFWIYLTRGIKFCIGGYYIEDWLNHHDSNGCCDVHGSESDWTAIFTRCHLCHRDSCWILFREWFFLCRYWFDKLFAK